MTTRNVPFFEYPRLWSDDREDLLSIIDNVSSTGGFILQKAVSDFESELASYADINFSVGVGNATDGMEIFLEAINDDGLAIGVSYIPTRDVGSKSRSDSNTDGDTGTYKAQAELDNVFKLYADIPTSASIAGGTVYVHLGVQHVTLATLESLNSGATYPNKDLFGGTIGLGTKGDIPYGNNLYYKTEVTYTNFETYEADGAGNKVVADLEDIAARLSIGYKF